MEFLSVFDPFGDITGKSMRSFGGQESSTKLQSSSIKTFAPGKETFII
jgi:hypothetical protein